MDTASHTASQSLAGRAYADLKTRILLGEFPLNVRLGEERLAALVGVSRTPVREALLRLHTENLLERHPDGGYCPTAPDVALVHDLYEVRLALELQALRRPGHVGGRHDHEVLEPLRDEWRVMAGVTPPSDPGFVLRDESFHVTLAEAAGNPMLGELLCTVNERIRIVRMHDFLTDERVERTVAQHLGIVEAVLVGRSELAIARFQEHLGESMAVVEERATVALARMATSRKPMAREAMTRKATRS